MRVIKKSLKSQPSFIFEAATGPHGRPVLQFPFMAISDLHLGTIHCRARRLSHMLEHTVATTLKAVGDVVDLEDLALRDAWSFPPWHRQVLGHLLRKSAHYFPGNHDDVLRDHVLGKKLFDIAVDNQAIYVDPCGRQILIKHGDDYDDRAFGDRKKFWYRLGDTLHAPLAHFDTFVQRAAALEGLSVAATIKKLIKLIINKGLGVEATIMKSIDDDPKLDGLLYGHSHMGGITRTPAGKLLLNDGCSTEHVQAMVHDKNGTFALITWHKNRIDVVEENGCAHVMSFAQLGLDPYRHPPMIEDIYTAQADRLIRIMHRLTATPAKPYVPVPHEKKPSTPATPIFTTPEPALYNLS